MEPTEIYSGTKCNPVPSMLLLFVIFVCSECLCASILFYIFIFMLVDVQHATQLVCESLKASLLYVYTRARLHVCL